MSVSTPDNTTKRAGSPWRSVVSGLVGVIALIGLTGATVGFWTLRTAEDSDRFEARVEHLLQREDISTALARRVVAEVVVVLPLADAVDEVVPTVLKPAADMLLAGVRSQVEERLAEAIRSPRVSGIIAASAGAAYATAVKVLEGDHVVNGVAIEGGEVRVNLLPLTATTISLLQNVGLFGDVVVPEFDRAGDPAEQRAELSAALGVDLPADFGEPVMFRSDAVDELGTTVQLARDLLVFAKRAMWILLVSGVVLCALSIWLARRRWRAAAFFVAGVLAVTLVVRIVLRIVSNRAPDAVDEPGAKATVAEIIDGLQRSLNHAMLWYSALAVVALVLAVVVASRTSGASSPA